MLENPTVPAGEGRLRRWVIGASQTLHWDPRSWIRPVWPQRETPGRRCRGAGSLQGWGTSQLRAPSRQPEGEAVRARGPVNQLREAGCVRGGHRALSRWCVGDVCVHVCTCAVCARVCDTRLAGMDDPWPQHRARLHPVDGLSGLVFWELVSEAREVWEREHVPVRGSEKACSKSVHTRVHIHTHMCTRTGMTTPSVSQENCNRALSFLGGTSGRSGHSGVPGSPVWEASAGPY